MGRGSRFLADDDVVIKVDKLKALEQAAATKETDLVKKLRKEIVELKAQLANR